jgi:adenylosuccinate synthase
MVIRFAGGANAGHTIVVKGKKVVTHLLPSGIIRPRVKNIVGPGVVCTLSVLRDELAIANECGSEVLLDRSTPIVHAIHRWFDAARESGSGAIGTTKRGIGPAYADVSARRAVRLGDMVNADRVRRALTEGSYYKELAAAATAYDAPGLAPFPSLDEVIAEIMEYREDVVHRLCDSRFIVHDQMRNNPGGSRILFEGAQGVMLDVNGPAPHTTSSICTAAGVSASFGVYDFGAVIGVTKAYTTRVGEGPFPTELHDDRGERLRRLGGEFGATTGRPRRCGWLDGVALRYAVRMGGITHLCMTKLDVLYGFEKVVRLGVEYELEGRALHEHETLTSFVLREFEVRYIPFPGCVPKFESGCTLEELPGNMRFYISRVEEIVGVPVIAAGYGSEREQLAM